METNSAPYGCERWFDLKSSMVTGAGVREGWLVVRFSGGAHYRYENAAHELERLVEAESVGRHFNRNIKGRYGYQKLGSEWTE